MTRDERPRRGGAIGALLMPATIAIDDVWAPWTLAIRRAAQAADADLVTVIDEFGRQLER